MTSSSLRLQGEFGKIDYRFAPASGSLRAQSRSLLLLFIAFKIFKERCV